MKEASVEVLYPLHHSSIIGREFFVLRACKRSTARGDFRCHGDGRANFDKLWLEAGGSFFSSYTTEVSTPESGQMSVQVYVQAKDAKFSVKPSSLTRADIENGQEWDGTLTVVAAIVRTYEKDQGWGLWRDGPVILYKAHYGRNRGSWTGSGRAYIYDDNHELRRPAQAEIATLNSVPVNPPVTDYNGPHGEAETVPGQ